MYPLHKFIMQEHPTQELFGGLMELQAHQPKYLILVPALHPWVTLNMPELEAQKIFMFLIGKPEISSGLQELQQAVAYG